VLGMPVPDRLRNAARPSADVIDFGAARTAKTRAFPTRWILGGAIAASLALGLVVGTQMPDSSPIGDSGGKLIAQGSLDKALTTQLASTEAQPVRIPLSFKNADSHYCRVFDTDTMAGIACRSDNAWVIDRLQSGGKGADKQYRQAESAMGEIMAAAQMMAPYGALLPQEEGTARSHGWK
jgi:hypothetical protein